MNQITIIIIGYVWMIVCVIFGIVLGLVYAPPPFLH